MSKENTNTLDAFLTDPFRNNYIVKKSFCNVCGRELDAWDEQEDFTIHKHLGYGTKYDGEILNLHICCNCMDSLINSCKLSPIV